MALPDDLNRLAQQDVVYLTRVLTSVNPGSTTIFRGRLHQALNGNWVFNTSTGQNGVVGIDLGQQGGGWSSTDSPAAGLQITIIYNIIPTEVGIFGGQLQFTEIITLTSVIPVDLAD